MGTNSFGIGVLLFTIDHVILEKKEGKTEKCIVISQSEEDDEIQLFFYFLFSFLDSETLTKKLKLKPN